MLVAKCFCQRAVYVVGGLLLHATYNDQPEKRQSVRCVCLCTDVRVFLRLIYSHSRGPDVALNRMLPLGLYRKQTNGYKRKEFTSQ